MRGVSIDTARKIALGLADVEESTAYGAMAFKVRGKLLACTAVNKSAEPGSLMVRSDHDRRMELIAESPDVYYLTDHYASYPAVLVRLSRIQPDALRDLLGVALRFVTAKKKRAARPGATR